MTKILITNDDGIDAEGIRYLIEAMHPLGEIIVVAPATEQSGVGVSITLGKAIKTEDYNLPCQSRAHKVYGTPADCVRLALHWMKDTPPDIIVSGINRGTNLGCNVFSSGTVGAVIEGRVRGVPGIAFSASHYSEPNFADYIYDVRSITEHMLEHPLPDHTLLNVNFPTGTAKGIRFTRQGLGHWDEEFIVDDKSYTIQGGPKLEGEHPDGEVSLFHDGYITAVPLRIFELTHDHHLDGHKELFEKRLNGA